MMSWYLLSFDDDMYYYTSLESILELFSYGLSFIVYDILRYLHFKFLSILTKSTVVFLITNGTFHLYI